VIVTDSTYVASGTTEWMRTWTGRKWVTSSSSKVQNKDLWKLLSTKMGECAEGGCEVSFWVVPRKWNEEADRAASEGATRPQIQMYVQQTGAMV
jgi:ribonuclease HI